LMELLSHSSTASGGALNSMKTRAVSAPYLAVVAVVVEGGC
jgi:hypothetical protein